MNPVTGTTSYIAAFKFKPKGDINTVLSSDPKTNKLAEGLRESIAEHFQGKTMTEERIKRDLNLIVNDPLNDVLNTLVRATILQAYGSGQCNITVMPGSPLEV